MKRVFLITLGVLILGVFIWTAFFLFRKSQAKPVVYKTETPFKTDITKKTVATGTIVAKREINLKSQVSGVVEKIYVEEGQIVKAGDLIAKVKLVPNMVTLNSAEAGLALSKVNFENAKIEYERNKKLFDEGVISEAEFNRFQLSYNQAKSQLQSDQSNVSLIRQGSAGGGRASNLVKATTDGMVLDIPVKEGGFVIESNTFNEGTTIASIADMNSLQFEGKVDESEVGKLKLGMPIKLSIGAVEGKTFDAVLDFIAPKGEVVDGAVKFEVKAAIRPDKDNFIRAGYSANADIVLDARKHVLAIKEGLLQFDKDKSFVEIETAPQVFERRFVKTGISDGINVEIVSGIKEGDKIKISENNYKPDEQPQAKKQGGGKKG